MKKTSTPSFEQLPGATQATTDTMTPIHTYSHTSGETRTAGPRKSTLDFLRQLARAYSPEPRVAVAELRGAIMN